MRKLKIMQKIINNVKIAKSGNFKKEFIVKFKADLRFGINHTFKIQS